LSRVHVRHDQAIGDAGLKVFEHGGFLPRADEVIE
jgi:hypothetical protein